MGLRRPHPDLKVEEFYRPGKERPVLVVGLPGIGGVGRLVADWLRELTDAKLLCRIYSRYFPDQIQVTDRSYEPLNYSIHHTENVGRDLLILTGGFQPDPTSTEAPYRVAEGIVEYVQSLGCRTIVAVDGMTEQEGIAVTSNKLDVLKKLVEAGAKPFRGRIDRVAGLMLGLIRLRDESICVGVLSGCRDVRRDEAAALRALRFIDRILGLNLSI